MTLERTCGGSCGGPCCGGPCSGPCGGGPAADLRRNLRWTLQRQTLRRALRIGPPGAARTKDTAHVRFSDLTGHPDIGCYLYLALRDWHPQGQKHLGWVRIDPVDQLDTEFARIGADGAAFFVVTSVLAT